ncbi:di-heme-cytochrome C peroxidase [Mesorhizobium sp. M0019]|uniref:di-heme-cytochrome C peroxidase n=1 Tax=Mesorhizobium sp. M0019 TaxID=2956845 RepID=UPI00333BE127
MSIYYQVIGGGVTTQGWTEADRTNWYSQSQGSRLLPYKWFQALEQPGTTGRFADEAYLASFGHLLAPQSRLDRLPIGFAVDRQPDESFVVTKLRWYSGQSGATKEKSEPWLGLNCAACHTNEVRFQGKIIRIDGGPGLSDLQSFSEALDQALLETRDNEDRFGRFAAGVLEKNDETNRGMLRAALTSLVAWQEEARRLNKTDLRYGFARLDAFGRIFNKIQMFARSTEPPLAHVADAPVSYPFLWGINLQSRVQWNGLAESLKVTPFREATFDIGALGRNAAEALGTFAEVVLVPTTPSSGSLNGNGPVAGYATSINVNNLSMFELLVAKLESPKWPEIFPALDQAKVDSGAKLFVEKGCADCHRTPGAQKLGETVERMVGLAETAKSDAETNEKNLTDITMACNVFMGMGRSGKLTGTKTSYFSLTREAPLDVEDNLAAIMGVATRGALVRKKGDIALAAAATFLGIPHWQGIIVEGAPPFNPRADCTRLNEKVLAYKAGPLRGIWATAPYLHNGSVPTLYHLLLPGKDRPKTFWVGSREYDPKFGGMTWDKKQGDSNFEYHTVDSDGQPIVGNANFGHEYGASAFSDDERWALVEYLKSL